MFLVSGWLFAFPGAGWAVRGEHFLPLLHQPVLGRVQEGVGSPWWVGALHGPRGSPPGCSLLLPWDSQPDTAAWDGFPPRAQGCHKHRGGKR